MPKTGRRQYVQQGQAGSISFRLLDDVTSDEIALSTTASDSSLVIYGTGGGELVSSTAPSSVSGAVATYSRTWDAATFSRLRGYKVVWTLQDGSGTDYVRTQYIEVVRRLFRSQLTDADFTAKHPYISSRLPSGLSDFSTYREDAWSEIERMLTLRLPEVRAKILGRFSSEDSALGGIAAYADSPYPGNLFNPEDFFDAHKFLTLSDFFMAISFDASPESDESAKAEYYRERGLAAFEAAASRAAFDLDDDGLLDVREREFVLGAIERVR